MVFSPKFGKYILEGKLQDKLDSKQILTKLYT